MVEARASRPCSSSAAGGDAQLSINKSTVARK
jgi:hypothetical protein